MLRRGWEHTPNVPIPFAGTAGGSARPAARRRRGVDDRERLGRRFFEQRLQKFAHDGTLLGSWGFRGSTAPTASSTHEVSDSIR